MMWYDIFNRNWVDTRWQQYSSHLHTNNTRNTENRTYITIKKLNIPCLCKLYPGICLKTEEKARKNLSWVAARTSQADTVQYTDEKQ
jgi:hypothetical protein